VTYAVPDPAALAPVLIGALSLIRRRSARRAEDVR
jgi:hypothetical protein